MRRPDLAVPLQPAVTPTVLQLAFPVKPWTSRSRDLQLVGQLLTSGLPAVMLYEAIPSKDVHTCEQLADLFAVVNASCGVPVLCMPHALMPIAFCLVQDPRDFVDVLTPQLPVLFKFLAYRSAVYLPFVKHAVLGDAGTSRIRHCHSWCRPARHLKKTYS